MKKILVTGGAGFIGSHLVEKLLEQDYEVFVVDNESAISSDKFYWFDKAKNYKFDILEKEKLEKIFQNNIDFVFHLAAETRIQPSIKEPEKCFNTNINGTINILELAKKYKTKRIIFASTSAVYGLNEPPNFEEQKMDCLNPYSASKLCGEILCNTYTKIYNLETICFRFFNVYGERMPDKGDYSPVIAIFKRQKKNNEAMTIVGSGLQVRDFIHVKDIVSGLISGMNTKNPNALGQSYNLGTQHPYSVLEIAKLLKGNYVHIPERIGNAQHAFANIDKAKRDLEWFPQIRLEDWLND